jgi:hypothetical protein
VIAPQYGHRRDVDQRVPPGFSSRMISAIAVFSESASEYSTSKEVTISKEAVERGTAVTVGAPARPAHVAADSQTDFGQVEA